MRSRALAVLGILLVGLVAGCAKTPATTTASAPSPTGSALTVPTTRAMDGSGGGGVRAASATGIPMRERLDQYRAVGDLVDIQFDFDKYDIRPDAAKVLDANVTWLKANPRQLVLIEGHCDERGTVEYNLALGERRAKATQNYLAAHGIASRRITTVSYGKERPQCTESSEACWATNRRAHFMAKSQ